MRLFRLGLRTLPILLLCLLTGVVWAPRARAGFRLEAPPGWIEARHGLDNALVRQFIAPDGGALVEFYVTPRSGQELKIRADEWEQSMLGQGLPYQRRVGEHLEATADGAALLVREYEGRSAGADMRVLAAFTGDAASDYVFQGMYTSDAELSERPVVLRCLEGLYLESPAEP